MRIVGKADALERALEDASLPSDCVPFVLRVPVDEGLAV
jgi:hypothetical protein